MKAKLVKKDDHYFLEVEPYKWKPLNEFPAIIANTFDKPKGDILQLSLKNCQAIERGYDLDELKRQASSSQTAARMFFSNTEFIRGWEMGFQKSLKLMGDKKFSEDDIHHAIDISVQWALRTKGVGETYQEMSQRILKSIQQTEWEVEVEVTGIDCGINDEGQRLINVEPKLDADGCLILKRT